MSRLDTPSAGVVAAMQTLEERVGPVIAQTVDALQVAALLEADGITDEVARDVYGCSDVFRLAVKVRRRCLPGAETSRRAPTVQAFGDLRGVDRHGPRLLAHGPLYLLPATLFPPVLALLGSHRLVTGLVVGAGLAWVWAGVSTWLAYRLLGLHRDTDAARLLQLSALTGLPLAAGGAVVVTLTSGGGPGLVAVACGQMAYQMGATLLMFHHRERHLLLAMLPAVLAGLTYLALPRADASAVLAVAVGTMSVVAVLVLSLDDLHGIAPRTSLAGMLRAAAEARDSVRTAPGQVGLVALHTALSAAYLLHAQSRYLGGSLQVSAGLLPLIVGMGLVELLAHRFRARAHALLGVVSYPSELARRVLRLVVGDVVACAVGVLVLGSVLLVALDSQGLLTAAGVAMTVAGAFLAAAYYVSFLLIGMGMLGPLIASVGLALAVHVLVAALVPAARHGLADTSAFAGTALLLLVVSLSRLVPAVTDPRAHA
jgi:hypothetical protein